LATLLGILLIPTALLAQTPESRIESARGRIAELGYPATLLDERIAEGRAKGVPMERIAAAVERRAVALHTAGTALRPFIDRPSAAELSAGADAIEAGIPPGILGRIASGA